MLIVVSSVFFVMIVLQVVSVRLAHRKREAASMLAQAVSAFMYGIGVLLMGLNDRVFRLDQPHPIIFLPFAVGLILVIAALVVWIKNWLKVNEVRVTHDATSITLAWSRGGTIRKMHQPKGGFANRLTGVDLDSNPNPWTQKREIG